MRQPWQRVLWLALIAVALAGCSSSSEDGAGHTVQQFYENLNGGDYRAAIALYNAEARAVIQDPDMASDSAFADWAKLETKNGTVDRVDVVQAEETGDVSTTVGYRVVYRDGSSVDRTVTVTLEDGQWKLGLIG